MQGKCCYCGKEYTVKNTGSYNRSIRLGLPVFCNKTCYGLSRRINETPEEKKQIKQWYDLILRVSRSDEETELEKFKRMVYFQFDYNRNPGKYKEWRKKRMPKHVEYCRQPKYKEYKKRYDQSYRAKKDYGEFAEAAITLMELEKEIDVRLAKKQNGLINKSQKRKRLWQKMQAKQNLSSLLEI